MSLGDLGDQHRRAPQQITHLNDTAPKGTHKVESIEWTSDAFHVQGWLTYPKDYDAKKKYPKIVDAHCGPSAFAGPLRGFSWSDLGYIEFSPNPRGSFGQGEAFVQANRKGLRLRRPATTNCRVPHRLPWRRTLRLALPQRKTPTSFSTVP